MKAAGRARWPLPATALGLLLGSAALPALGWLDGYTQIVFSLICINVIFTVSLNLVNGYLGEFSVGHAGFAAVGAYLSAWLTARVLTPEAAEYLFPLVLLVGGAGAAVVGWMVGALSFRTRGDYLAIVTLAFLMIIKSALENMDVVGGARGLGGMPMLTTPFWACGAALMALLLIRNLVFSSYGRDILAIREDETAAALIGVDTRRAKMLAFTVAAFFAGVAGGLQAHLLQFIAPKMFDIGATTEMLVMVYLGGVASITGSVAGGVLYTGLMQVLPGELGAWRMVVMPALLVVVMLVRRRGLFGLWEVPWLLPKRDLPARGRHAGSQKPDEEAAPTERP